MKRLFSIDEIHKIIESKGIIELFFYRSDCGFSTEKFNIFIKHKHIKPYILSYRIFTNLALQFDIEVLPSILILNKNGVVKKYEGGNSITQYIILKELEFEEREESYENKGTQTGNLTDSSDSEIDITYQILSPYVLRDNVDIIATNQ